MNVTDLSIVSAGVAFLGGLASFVSPCVLPLVPIYLGHLSGAAVREGLIESGSVTFFHAVAFVTGFSVLFIFLGATVGLLGGSPAARQMLISKVAGVLLIAMGIYMTGALKLPGLRVAFAPVTRTLDKVYYRERRANSFGAAPGDSKPGYWRSMVVGGAFAVGWVPCITPVLGAILTLAYASVGTGQSLWGTAAEAAVLLAFYAGGLSLPFLISGLMLGRITPVLKRLNQFLPAVTAATGTLMIAMGALVYFNLVVRLNQYFGFLPYVKF